MLNLSDFIEHVGGQLADWLEDVDNANLYLDSFFDDDDDNTRGQERWGIYST